MHLRLYRCYADYTMTNPSACGGGICRESQCSDLYEAAQCDEYTGCAYDTGTGMWVRSFSKSTHNTVWTSLLQYTSSEVRHSCNMHASHAPFVRTFSMFHLHFTSCTWGFLDFTGLCWLLQDTLVDCQHLLNCRTCSKHTIECELQM